MSKWRRPGSAPWCGMTCARLTGGWTAGTNRSRPRETNGWGCSMRIKITGLKRYKDRLGIERVYHRKSGTPIDPKLTGQALAAEVDRLDKLHAPKMAQSGTLGALLESYKKSPKFTDLAPRTQSDYQKYMDHLKPIAGTPLALIDTAFMAKLRDKTVKKRRGAFTNHMMAMLSSAFKHGKEYGLVTSNPCLELEKARIAKDRRKENRPWTKTERVNVLAAAPLHYKVPIALARFLAMRRGDILRLPRMAYRDGYISFRASKNGKIMKLPALGELRKILDEALEAWPVSEIDVTMLCLNSHRKPWTEMGFSASIGKFFDDCVARGLAGKGLTMHGLRHSVATDLREQGYRLEDIKNFLGQETIEMAEHYSSSADVSGVLIDMANVIQAGSKRERVLSNSRKKSV
ncbi:MAG: site-specific recombinase [Mesorhizobium sp.]|nr:site-specific recombinase [Mesorhizobium sp. M2A.F.Ca.ET.046.03.2.1]RUY06129.1 site-specific recombinase [Mesorhizobium sp. M2A.F.Ca.ET.040.01.1.1]RVC65897.1 site-specific recombinase [Mesorhizobium sp. M00.F.Ca.ET.038.03.1.1]RVC76858.1 site-specific recombinase [Mesorhizobium sp. M2A.F.Ca.ET.046.02.1.1]RWA87883.1 MAG: site-specific recombinase [Mesorhizobium sp.]RWX71763.1 site-specific recombinase [Mesorhizobium sp. M2A.F.Ca.ET.039.01.1.1]